MSREEPGWAAPAASGRAEGELALRAAPRPLIAAVEMGYGHLRAARALADAAGEHVALVDREPWTLPLERRLWDASRKLYEVVSRGSQRRAGKPLKLALDWLTAVPEHPSDDPHAGLVTLGLARAVERGLGRELARRLDEQARPLLTTFFTPALAAAHHGHDPVYCVVTDTEVSRAWVGREPEASGVRYLVPGRRGEARLLGYGVPREHVVRTGFPLPPSLLGGNGLSAAREHLAARITRLDPAGTFRHGRDGELRAALGSVPIGGGETPHLVFAVGGAGAQAGLVDTFLPAVRSLVLAGRLRLTLVAGIRAEIALRFRAALAEHGIPEAPMLASYGTLVPAAGGVGILAAADLDAYFDTFAALLAGADILWSKPSELTFYAALGLPILLARPVGAHEVLNRQALLDAGAGIYPPRLDELAGWLARTLANGGLAAAAWNGFTRLPRRGTYRILERVCEHGNH